VENYAFEIESGGAPEFRPHIRWAGGYRVIQLGDEEVAWALPGKERLLTLEEVQDQRNILILGERSGGIGDFLR